MDSFLYFVENLVQSKPLLSIPLVFVSGILMSFTPCFYPLVPVVLGVIGISEETSTKRAFFLGGSFVLGLSFIYTLLGVFSSLTGVLFGEISKSLPVQFFGGAVFFLLGIALLDFIHLPSMFSFNIQKVGKPRFFKVFVIGVLSGLVMGGCTLPVLGAILVLMAFYNDVVMGGLLLFVFSLGIGVMFILVALFGTKILTFFKSNDKVFIGIKKLFGISILLISVYFFVRGFNLL